MTWSVHQHWDPLKVCVVGRSYPPEFYSWITVPHVRELFEKIAIETEEDFQNIIDKLQSFGVEVLRPDIPDSPEYVKDNVFMQPPMTPRDDTAMIGNAFYFNHNYDNLPFSKFYNDIKDSAWPDCSTIDDFKKLPHSIQLECQQIHNMDQNVGYKKHKDSIFYDKILDRIQNQGNKIKRGVHPLINGAMVSRIGKDLYFGTEKYTQDIQEFQSLIDSEFISTRNHIVNTGGHSDGTYCPICPGLIISLNDIPTYTNTFPDWEVIYLPNKSWAAADDFLKLKIKNRGRWWIPGFEHDAAVIDTVEQWLSHWMGYVEETVFDVNILIVDPKNVLVFNYNKQVFDALDRFGITAHITPFRHRYFWDGGIHCVTADLHRCGKQEDFFPGRS